jgi:hypothetical protein
MRRRQGRPGLVGTMARTAVITGTASAVSGSVAQRQHAKEQAATPPAPEPHPTTESTLSDLERLVALKQKGLLTDDEFAALKARLLTS